MKAKEKRKIITFKKWECVLRHPSSACIPFRLCVVAKVSYLRRFLSTAALLLEAAASLFSHLWQKLPVNFSVSVEHLFMKSTLSDIISVKLFLSVTTQNKMFTQVNFFPVSVYQFFNAHNTRCKKLTTVVQSFIPLMGLLLTTSSNEAWLTHSL